MAVKKPRKFLCIGGALDGMRLTFQEAELEGYTQYNISFGQGARRNQKDKKLYPTAIMVWVERMER